MAESTGFEPVGAVLLRKSSAGFSVQSIKPLYQLSNHSLQKQVPQEPAFAFVTTLTSIIDQKHKSQEEISAKTGFFLTVSLTIVTESETEGKRKMGSKSFCNAMHSSNRPHILLYILSALSAR